MPFHLWRRKQKVYEPWFPSCLHQPHQSASLAGNMWELIASAAAAALVQLAAAVLFLDSMKP
jgi:hypothetical protein